MSIAKPRIYTGTISDIAFKPKPQGWNRPSQADLTAAKLESTISRFIVYCKTKSINSIISFSRGVIISMSMYRAMQNPDTPNLPFAQRPNPRYDKKTVQTSCYEVFGTKLHLTDAAAQHYRNAGTSIKRCSSQTTPPPNYSKHGCDCPNCKNGIGECSDKCAKCNAWDIGCEMGCATDVIVDFGEKTHEDIVDWGEKTHDDITTAIDEAKKKIDETVEVVIETVEDIPKTITDPITKPIEALKYLPLILIGGVALLVMRR